MWCIWASPSHLRVNFHYWVTFRVCRAPKIPNQPLIPFFVILLSFLHPKRWSKSTFDAQGPKPSINSKSQAKVATTKKLNTKRAIFWKKEKNTSFDFAQNGLKYTSRIILHFDNDLALVDHQKLLTTAKLRLLVQLTPPLGEIDERARRWPERVQGTLKHFSHVKYILISLIVPPRGLFGIQGGPKMTRNSTKTT